MDSTEQTERTKKLIDKYGKPCILSHVQKNDEYADMNVLQRIDMFVNNCCKHCLMEGCHFSFCDDEHFLTAVIGAKAGELAKPYIDLEKLEIGFNGCKDYKSR